ncbi:MAG: hypothetical protein HN727_06150, partial [Opitutae bacterium]|nr:hypothetical protein [Opitutae bacterium]
MGTQYKKVIKRKRRKAYLARRKAALKESLPASKKGRKTAAAKPKSKRKASPKKSASEKVKEEVVEEPVADKASSVDILGVDSVEEKETSSEET